ncbi:5-fold beta-flower protein [Streptomyces anandii]|uniref:5-fold beta-flower protein n=1 Tax=Streptomyces anandii TaxID=285454 RepID=UPI0016766E06|nr:hypothetical protein [Streptomyces anandii]GGX66226.1 hypothetical protein GCM10010510_07960 [Streptomyces anandii JCM 4720]
MSYLKDTYGSVIGHFTSSGTVTDTGERSVGRVDWKGAVYDNAEWCVGSVSSIGRVVDGNGDFAGKVEGNTVYGSSGDTVGYVDAETYNLDPYAVTDAQRAGAGLLLLLKK